MPAHRGIWYEVWIRKHEHVSLQQISRDRFDAKSLPRVTEIASVGQVPEA